VHDRRPFQLPYQVSIACIAAMIESAISGPGTREDVAVIAPTPHWTGISRGLRRVATVVLYGSISSYISI
jgi:hypothetical protein